MSHESQEPTLRQTPGAPADLRLAPDFPVVGQPWGKYLIVKGLGAGGEGAVFEAFDQVGPAGCVALKVPLDPVAPTEVKAWVGSEVDALAGLDHPNIVRVVDGGCVGGTPYVATQLVEGLPLNAHVKANPPTLRQILDWMVQLADAVHYAHSRGVVHRDLKPLNIIITPEGRPRLLDFGFAQLVSPYGEGAKADVAGTPAFMAPEQARGDPQADQRMDVFALGGVLKYLLDGSGPYGPGLLTARDALQSAREGKVEQADCHSGPALRRALARIANRALAADPSQRHPSAREMGRELRRLRSRRAWLGGTALALLAAAAAVGIVAYGWLRPKPLPPPVGSLEVHFQRARQSGSHQVLTGSDVPLRTGDRIRIVGKLNQPLFVYLVAASSDGGVRVVHPPEGVAAEPVSEVRVPPGQDEWFEIEPPAGTETLVLLARHTALRDTAALVRGLMAQGRAPALDGAGLLLLDERGPRLIAPGPERKLGSRPVKADAGFLDALASQVPREWAVVRAIAFPHQSPGESAASPEGKRDGQPPP